MNEVLTPISYGELIDKITILEIKSERISNTEKLANIRHELRRLNEVWEGHNDIKTDISLQWQQLSEINSKLWDLENDIRKCEKNADFGDNFIELARAVYLTNDERHRIKHEISQLLCSAIVEEKLYTDYSRPKATCSGEN